MGTRSNTVVVSDGKEIVRIYRQMDGYPSCHGADLKEILGKSKLINGFGAGEHCPKQFNGMSCLAAYLVGKLKGGEIGGIYIQPKGRKPDQFIDDWAEYLYTIYDKENDDRVYVKIRNRYTKGALYDGPIGDVDMEKLGKQ